MEIKQRYSKPGVGRKKAMDKNGYWEWVNEVLVVYLNKEDEYSGVTHIRTPLECWVKASGIMFSMEKMDAIFRQPGIAEFKKWFSVSTGNNHTGFSTATMTTNFDGRKSIYDHLIKTGLINKVQKDQFSFVAGIEYAIKRRNQHDEQKRLDVEGESQCH